MLAADIIEKLKQFPPNTEVVIYDEDNDYTTNIKEVTIDNSHEVDYQRIALVRE